GAPTGAYHRPDGSALPAARDRADDGAERCADRASLDRFFGLAVCRFDLPFVIDPDRLSCWRAHTFDDAAELRGSAVALADGLKVQRHFRSAAHASRGVYAGDEALNDSAAVLRRRVDRHRKAVAITRRLGA